ncbi:flavin reductase, partial [Raoultella ornithinolytica]|uniref:flavin reductase n=1 Tax=Raoultella ornithinolytica TaxID=54291 RepID=UPI002553BC7D
MNLTSDFRNAMAQLGSAITIITTDGPAGRFGFTASAVCSVTDSPPTLLVCMNRSSFAHGKFKENGVLCVNVLSGQHQNLSAIFANSQLRSEERFLHDQWLTLETGSPVLG